MLFMAKQTIGLCTIMIKLNFGLVFMFITFHVRSLLVLQMHHNDDDDDDYYYYYYYY